MTGKTLLESLVLLGPVLLASVLLGSASAAADAAPDAAPSGSACANAESACADRALLVASASALLATLLNDWVAEAVLVADELEALGNLAVQSVYLLHWPQYIYHLQWILGNSPRS